jgi:predicted NUDIX family NTP pyrophosphohydrolase
VENAMTARTTPHSAGILLYRVEGAALRVLLGHPGGPFFAKKDAEAWTIPKGLLDPNEPPEVAALREFGEELGWQPQGPLVPLGEIRMKSGKRVTAFAVRDDAPEAEQLDRFQPGEFELEWPPHSGRWQAFPEIDRIAFYELQEAREKIIPAQAALLSRLEQAVRAAGDGTFPSS